MNYKKSCFVRIFCLLGCLLFSMSALSEYKHKAGHMTVKNNASEDFEYWAHYGTDDTHILKGIVKVNQKSPNIYFILKNGWPHLSSVEIKTKDGSTAISLGMHIVDEGLYSLGEISSKTSFQKFKILKGCTQQVSVCQIHIGDAD